MLTICLAKARAKLLSERIPSAGLYFTANAAWERDTHTFATEAEACDHLLANLRNDPNTH